jgi:hypothetical protein
LHLAPHTADPVTEFICSMAYLSGFETISWNAGDDPEGKMDTPQCMPTTKTYETFLKECKEVAEEYDLRAKKRFGLSSGHNQCLHRMAVVMAATSHLQKKTEEYLERMGFVRSGPFKKLKHKGSDLSIWLMPASAFMEVIGYEGIAE